MTMLLMFVPANISVPVNAQQDVEVGQPRDSWLMNAVKPGRSKKNG